MVDPRQSGLPASSVGIPESAPPANGPTPESQFTASPFGVPTHPVAADEGPVVAETALSETEQLERTLAEIPERFEAVRTELAKAIVGQDGNIEAAFYALLSRGHCLIVGVPGLAKTLLVQALARVLRLGFK
ncbi:MAG: AAA family ATPase, partial [Planctomycetota bacterium]